MNNVKNLAGNDVSIFLFRFNLSDNGIHFVVNQAIAADMYQDVDAKLKPLAHACCETLLRYRYLSVSNTIMDGNILDTGEFEVMLSKGLGRHFAETEKQQVKPRRAPAFGPARHWRFAGGALTPPLTKGMLTPPWNPSIRFPALTGGA